VSSRNRPDIEERLRPAGSRAKISLELNSSHISRAINAFIDFKVSKLMELKGIQGRSSRENQTLSLWKGGLDLSLRGFGLQSASRCAGSKGTVYP
jgi:hypothetical protein